MTTEEWMTVPEVAARWRVSRMTIYRLVNDGMLSALTVGRSVRIPLSAVETYEEGHTNG